MATTKNITMKQFNGTDYDTLYPKTVYSQVSGVAPAGYGLGSDSAYPPEDDADKCLLSGWYAISNMSNAPFAYCLIRVDRWYSKVIFQTAYQLGTNVIAQRCTDDGNWLTWEYVNPPLAIGVEYRTVERYNGKPVYAKLLNFGALPNSTSKSFAHGISSLGYVVDIYGQGVAGQDVKVSVDTTNITITSTSNLSAVTAYPVIKYTKTTD